MVNIKIFLFFLLILFIIYLFITIKQNSKKIIFYRKNNILSNKMNKYMLLYLKDLSIDEILFKTDQKYNFLQKTSLLSFYQQHFLDFSDNDKNNIHLHLDIINKHSKKYLKILNFNWKFIKFSNILEKNMPFTFADHILLPEIFLDNLNPKKNDILIENCDTLIHECIHVIQRENQTLLDNIYPNIFNCIKINNLIISNQWKKQKMTNPDGLNINWVYKYLNDYYLPMLIFKKSSRSVKQIIIKLKFANGKYYTSKNFMNIYQFPPFKKYPKNISLYHPNEIMAYILPKIILNTQKFKNWPKINILLNFLKVI